MEKGDMRLSKGHPFLGIAINIRNRRDGEFRALNLQTRSSIAISISVGKWFTSGTPVCTPTMYCVNHNKTK